MNGRDSASPGPGDEPARLAALERYAILDTPSEPAFDELVRLASRICGTPIALVSLVDATRQWFKARVGLEANETPRDWAFCAHAIQGRGLFEIVDAADDPRFRDNPLVTADPRIRFYAGMPLETPDGHALGTLCVIDRVPRRLTPEQSDALAVLARQVATLLELRVTVAGLETAMRERDGALAALAASEAALRRSEAEYRLLFEQSPHPAWVADLETLAFLAVNPAMERRYGYTRDELLAMRIPEVKLPEEVGALEPAIAQIRNGRDFKAVVRHRSKAGEVFDVELVSHPVTFGERSACLALAVDVTERVRLEKAKMEYVSAISHDLRTPLSSIIGALRLLEAGLAGAISARGCELVDVAARNSRRLLGLVNDILDLERLDAGQVVPVDEVAAVDELARRAAESVGSFAESREVALVLTPTPLRVRGDAGLLERALVNLVANAVKFSPRGERVGIGAEAVDGFVELHVADRGRGVPEALRNAIFERFRQVESSDALREAGAGLGLAIAKAVVERHGGAIGVRGRDGGGSVFWIRVPAADGVVERRPGGPP